MQPFLTVRQASATYPVYVGRNLLDDIRSLVESRGRIFVITSTVLRDRFGEQIAATLDADVIAIEEGEAHKTLETANDVVTQLLERGAKRDSMAVVVGGGMVGDTAGFAAAIFLRGVDLVHLPPTPLPPAGSSPRGGGAAHNAQREKTHARF